MSSKPRYLELVENQAFAEMARRNVNKYALGEAFGVGATTAQRAAVLVRQNGKQKVLPQAPALSVPIQNADTTDLSTRSVLVMITLRKWGNRRKLSNTDYRVGTDNEVDKRMTGAHKKLIDSAEFDKISSLDNSIYSYVYSRTLRRSRTRGYYLLATGLLPEVDKSLCDFKAARNSAVETFLTTYPLQKEDARRSLLSVWREGDYPSVDEMRGHFAMDWQYEATGVPSILKQIDADIFRREGEKAQENARLQWDEIRLALRARFADMLNCITISLAGGKKFYKSEAEKLYDFIEIFERTNLTDDDELASLVGQVRTLVDGVPPQALKSAADVQGIITTTFAEVNARMAEMVGVGVRRIRFDDDGD